jgi:ABC-type polysaccharide/polyol phosphate export permease
LARDLTSPTQANPFEVAFRDVAHAIQLAPVWLHAGWIDVIWRFRRTRLGPFWHTLGLAAFVLVIGTLWSTILRQDPTVFFRYVTVGMIVWGLIASFVTEGTGIIIAGQATALSMRYPYIAFALAHVWRALLLFAHHFVLYVVVMVGTLHTPGWAALIAVPALVLIAANGVWMSLLVAMMSLRRRDLIPAIASGMQIMMFVTPVFWPKDLLGQNLAWATELNPFYHMVQLVRDPLLGTVPSLTTWLWVIATLIVGSALTLWVYGRYRHRLPYWY